jgi:hypothetical protein
VPTARTCLVSFTDSENIRHAVEVSATTLYDAAVLAMAEFRRCGFTTDSHRLPRRKGNSDPQIEQRLIKFCNQPLKVGTSVANCHGNITSIGVVKSSCDGPQRSECWR